MESLHSLCVPGKEYLMAVDSLDQGEPRAMRDFRQALSSLPIKVLPFCLTQLCSRQHLLLRSVADEVACL
eukprot:1159087-Pelagomonas_calceolata.AAC.4